MMDDLTSPADPLTPQRASASRPAEGSAAVGEKTRATLLSVALDLFGRKGFDATSTRDIASAAGVNIAAIAYHFGGKAGLHRACGEAIADLLGGRIAALLPPDDAVVAQMSPDDAAALLEAAFAGFARFILARPEAEAVARFVVREQMDPTETFDILFERVIRPRHESLCRIFARATGGDATEQSVIVAVSALMGEIMFFRVARATALRRLNWSTIDETNVETVIATVLESMRALIRARREKTA